MMIKLFKKKTLKVLSKNFLIIILFLFLCVSFNLFENVFHIIKYNKNDRLLRNSPFCEKDSQGFIVHLNKKFNFTSNPIVLNNSISPMSDWLYYDFKKKDTNTKKIILLNYEEIQEIDTNSNNNEFTIKETPPLLESIIGIKMNFTKKIKNDKTVEVNIFKLSNGKKKKIYSQKAIINKGIDSSSIYFNLNESGGSKLRQYIVKFNSFDIAILSNVKFIVKNNIKLSNFTIIEKKQNCYFLRKND